MFPETMFFGLQAMLMGYLEGQVVTKDDITYAEAWAKKHFGRDDCFNKHGWELVLAKHGGTLPVEIKAVPEGMIVPNRNVLMTVETTDPDIPWLNNWLETFLVQVWYPCTVATLSRQVRKIILKYLEETGDPSLLDFKLHDFGFRGSTCIEAAGLGGMAHLATGALGTDTTRACDYASYYYDEDMAGFSIPAMEHSTVTSWGGPQFEKDSFANMLKQFPKGLIACVSDSYDIFNAVRELWGNQFKDQVLERDGCLVIRPDSGYPPAVILECCDGIWETFGGTVNSKGYKVFDPHVRLIQGDGIEWLEDRNEQGYEGNPVYRHTCEQILWAMQKKGYSADNIAFGSGGGLLQRINRDTQRFAFKCSATKRNGTWYDVWKQPITATDKNSKRGRLALIDEPNGLTTVTIESLITRVKGNPHDNPMDLLEPVFRNGEVLRHQTLADVRERASVSRLAEIAG
jgi:nicotinamide phosphoribosyltransferase